MPGELQIRMLGVGHGDCFCVRWVPEVGPPSTVVIDGGMRAGGEKLRDELRALAVEELDLLVLSHSDADHVDGLLAFAQLPHRPSVRRFWGPCLPAFERHRWLFADRVQRGLDITRKLQDAISGEASISWPVEHASWASADGGLRVRVLSPPGKLIERLLTGGDVAELFLAQPMPVGWLFDPDPPADPEDRFADLRLAIASGEIDPARVPLDLPPSSAPATREEMASEVRHETGADPEFFGNSVLNDTSIVLLVEADVGGVAKRALFPGDLQNFTYLMATQPMGLGLEVAKAPHHGSRSHVGDKLEAYDEVWQWLRPRVVMVSAAGKHGLPRVAFRDAALRTGATLFCTCRRGREIVVGQRHQTSCHAEFGCGGADNTTLIRLSQDGVTADRQACASGISASATPVIQTVQHLVDPSAVLDRLTTAERETYVRWLGRLLRERHAGRVSVGGEAGLEPTALSEVRREAVDAKLFRAAASLDIVVDAAARSGSIWASSADRFGRLERGVWTMPNEGDWRELERWLLGHAIVLFVVPDRSVGRSSRELLLAADVSGLSARAAERFAFPEAMFWDAIWPRLARRLVEKEWSIAAWEEELDRQMVTLVRCLPRGPASSMERLADRLPAQAATNYMLALMADEPSRATELPEELKDVISFYSLNRSAFRPNTFRYALTNTATNDHDRIFRAAPLVGSARRELIKINLGHAPHPENIPIILASFLLGGFTPS